MRNTEERVKVALLGAQELKRKQASQRRNAIVAGSTGLSLCLIILLVSAMPAMIGGDTGGDVTTGLTASVFSNSQFLSYIVIGMMSFILGGCVTILCVLLRKKQQKEHEEDEP